MRNLLEYPITDEEIIDYLEKLNWDITQENERRIAFGDMRPLLLKEAIRIIKEKSNE